jgi:putative membrane protein
VSGPAGADGSPQDRDIDARFLLANERTLLAWVRTALTLLAAGVGTLQLVRASWRTAPGISLLVLGAVAAAVGVVRYGRADRAIRAGRLPPAGRAPALVAGAVAAVAVALVVLSVVAAVS